MTATNGEQAVPRVRVAFLADTLLASGGMGRHAREVLAALGRRNDIELLPVVPKDAIALAERLGGAGVVDVEAIRGLTRLGHGLWERYRLGALAERCRCDVVHGVKHLVPVTGLPTVLTVHDVMPLTSREQFGLLKRVLLPSQFRSSLRDATMLVAVSNATAARVAEEVAGAAQKTVVVENGVGEGLLGVEPQPVRALHGAEFALVVGDLSPRKNVRLLLDVWDRVHASTGVVLAVVGPDGWRARETLQQLDGAIARGVASRHRDLTDAELRWCYERARVVLCPSIEEGFGLPAAEALALGAPVIASTDAALVEIARGHARHVDAQDQVGWQAAIEESLMAERALRVPVAEPTWDAHAAGLVAVYRQAILRAPAEG